MSRYRIEATTHLGDVVDECEDGSPEIALEVMQILERDYPGCEVIVYEAVDVREAPDGPWSVDWWWITEEELRAEIEAQRRGAA